MHVFISSSNTLASRFHDKDQKCVITKILIIHHTNLLNFTSELKFIMHHTIVLSTSVNQLSQVAKAYWAFCYHIRRQTIEINQSDANLWAWYANQSCTSCRRFIGDTYLVPPSTIYFAKRRFAASLGWYGSQNTYAERSSHMLEVGPHGIKPWYCPPLPQQG